MNANLRGLRTAVRGMPLIGRPLHRAFRWTALTLHTGWGKTMEVVVAGTRVWNRVASWPHAVREALTREYSVPAITKRNTRRAYDRVYADPKLLAEYLGDARLRFYDEVAEHCEALRPRRVLDLGCGSGEFLRVLHQRLELEVVVGVDHSASAIRRARETVPGGRFFARRISRLQPRAEYDLVVLMEVLEHLRRPQDALRVALNFCSDDGHVLVTVPDGDQDAWEGHVHFWNEPELQALLGEYGDASVRRIEEGRSFLGLVAPRQPRRQTRPARSSRTFWKPLSARKASRPSASS